MSLKGIFKGGGYIYPLKGYIYTTLTIYTFVDLVLLVREGFLGKIKVDTVSSGLYDINNILYIKIKFY